MASAETEVAATGKVSVGTLTAMVIGSVIRGRGVPPPVRHRAA